MISRQACLLSGSENLEDLHCFSDFPVFMGCVDIDSPSQMHLKADMHWQICRDTGMIQLKNLIDLEVLYPESHGSGLVGGLWNKHHSDFATFIFESGPSNILEIGGAHGILCDKFHEKQEIDWTIIEPNPTPKPNCKAKIIKGFFDHTYSHSCVVDTVVHSHVLEHIYDPQQFMYDLESIMSEGSNLIFSIPNMSKMLELKYTNVLNFEHTYFLDESAIDYMLDSHNFKVIRKHYFLDDHSIFYHVIKESQTSRKVGLSQLCNNIENRYMHNKNLFKAYIDHHIREVERLNLFLSTSDKPVFLFGAHVFSQYLISGFNLDTNNIICLLDNDPNKQGRILSGTDLSVNSPKVLAQYHQPVVILKAGVYNEEIKQDILVNINSNATFL